VRDGAGELYRGLQICTQAIFNKTCSFVLKTPTCYVEVVYTQHIREAGHE
jgi:hypothetical protein